MDEQRIDKWQSSEGFQRVGADLKDAIINRKRVEREAALAKKRAEKRLLKMQKREAHKQHKQAVRRGEALPKPRPILKFFGLVVLVMIWLSAMKQILGT